MNTFWERTTAVWKHDITVTTCTREDTHWIVIIEQLGETFCQEMLSTWSCCLHERVVLKWTNRSTLESRNQPLTEGWRTDGNKNYAISCCTSKYVWTQVGCQSHATKNRRPMNNQCNGMRKNADTTAGQAIFIVRSNVNWIQQTIKDAFSLSQTTYLKSRKLEDMCRLNGNAHKFRREQKLLGHSHIQILLLWIT